MGTGKKISIISLAITSCLCLGLIAWYVLVMVFAPAKIVSQTYEVGVQRVVDANGNVNAKNFIEVNVYNNCFEIKFNYMLDEKQTAYYSQGLQYVLQDGKSEFNFEGDYESIASTKLTKARERVDFEWPIADYETKYNRVLSDIVYKNIEKHNYMSADDYSTTLYSTNEIDLDTMFKIQIGEDLYGMKFKGADSIGEDDFYINTEKFLVDTTGYALWTNYDYEEFKNYKVCDVDLFSAMVYDACEPLKSGTSQSLVFEFGDLFNYYKYDEEKQQYVEDKIESDEYAKITADVKNYYCISVNKYDADLDSSSDSIFNCYKGKSNWNVETSINDYFLGRTLARATVKDFEFIETAETMVYDFKLRDEFINYYADFTKLELFVEIDLDHLKELGVIFNGFVDGTFDEFDDIYKIVTIETIDGELVEKAVEYA